MALVCRVSAGLAGDENAPESKLQLHNFVNKGKAWIYRVVKIVTVPSLA